MQVQRKRMNHKAKSKIAIARMAEITRTCKANNKTTTATEED